jgi:hypothetical protein
MTFDLYSKLTLTIIALSLASIVENVARPVMAQPEIQKVQICNDIGECAALQAVREPIPGKRGNFTMGLQVVLPGK